MGTGNYRNSLCHCGSGLKYKKCCLKKDDLFLHIGKNHLNDINDKERRILKSNDEREAAKLVSPKNKRCMFYGCNSTPIKSHTVPKSFLNNKFSEENSKGVKVVFWSNLKDIVSNTLDESKLGQSLYETPTNQAGVLPLFCSKHDNQLFSKIEDKNQNVTVEQYIFLMSYRSFIYNFYKEFSVRNGSLSGKINFDSQFHQVINQNIIDKHNNQRDFVTDYVADIFNFSNWEKVKHKFDRLLQRNSCPTNDEIDNEFDIYIFKISNDFLWTAHGVTEWSNKNDIKEHLPSCYGVVPSYQKFDPLFYVTVPKEENLFLRKTLIAEFKMFHSLYKLGINKEFLKIIQYMMIDCSENVILSPSLYKKLDSSNQLLVLNDLNISLIKKRSYPIGSIVSRYLGEKSLKLSRDLDLFCV